MRRNRNSLESLQLTYNEQYKKWMIVDYKFRSIDQPLIYFFIPSCMSIPSYYKRLSVAWKRRNYMDGILRYYKYLDNMPKDGI